MNTSTPFFPGFHHILFGRPGRSAQEKLQAQAEALRRASLCQLAKLFEASVPSGQLATQANQRRRCYPLAVTFWAFLSQTLNPGSPCRETVRKVQAWCAARKLPMPDTNTGGYCKARQRIDPDKLRELHQHGASRLEAQIDDAQLWQGRRVKVVDGTGLSMPDTAENQDAFPQSSGQKPGCGFPVVKIVACFCLHSGALIEWVEGTLRNNENILLKKLWRVFQNGDVFLADRGFCSFEAIATLLARGVDSVIRLHQSRSCDICDGKRIGKNEWAIQWTKPKKRPKTTKVCDWKRLPASLSLRYVKINISIPGFRTQEVIVVTTLTDTYTYTAEALGELYFRRWSVELFFRDIKITIGMDVLRCRTPAMIRKEIIMHAIAYNLIRGLMQEAAALYDVDLTRISFKGSVDALRQWREALNGAGNNTRELARLKAQLLQLLAEDLVPLRPFRSEPRAKKRRPKNYHLLTKPRHQMVVPPHRNRG